MSHRDNNSETEPTNVSAKIRRADYDAITTTADRYCSNNLEIISAMRRLWESAPQKQHLDALSRVRRRRREPVSV